MDGFKASISFCDRFLLYIMFDDYLGKWLIKQEKRLGLYLKNKIISCILLVVKKVRKKIHIFDKN